MRESGYKATTVPRHASLAARSAVLYSILVGAAVLIGGWLIHTGNREKVIEARERDLEHRARTVEARISTEVRALTDDVLFLAQAPFLRALADSRDGEQAEELKTEAEGIFAALLERKSPYAQTRLIELSAEGREIIRLDHSGDEVKVVPVGELQSKGHRDYFRESAKLGPGEIYLSSINLNREFGEISEPHMPTLRAAAKVFDSSGRPFAIVVVNFDLRPLFAELSAMAGDGFSLYIANNGGDYLLHPDVSKTFGFDLGEQHRVQEEFGSHVLESANHPRELARFIRVPLWNDAEHELIVGVGVPRALVLSELSQIWKRGLAIALALAALAAVVVWISANLLSRRLGSLADAIADYTPGSGTPELPEGGRDEVAVVARKFSSLAGKIDEQVTALDAARRIAEENRHAKEEFLANLSHEIRTPMNAVTGLLHTLSEDRPEEQREVIEALKFASGKLTTVVNDVLDFSKIEAGELRFQCAPFDLHQLLTSVEVSHLPQAREAGVGLSCAWAEEVPQSVEGDSLRLYQVLTNLVQNALKFTEEGGQVNVTVARKNRPPEGGDVVRLEFEVDDSGIGMSEEQLEQALSRFGQAGPEADQHFGGTGLGLPIARMLVESQGGEFRATSEPGVGSCFRFELEFGTVADGHGDPGDLPQERPDLRGVEVLCVEDVASNRQVVSALLEPCGADIRFATCAEEAMSLLEGAQTSLPDVILLDLQLPDRDGASLAVDLRKHWPAVPVVGLTAQTAGSLLQRAREAEVNTFIWKPIEADRFLREVRDVVGRARGDREGAPPRGAAPSQSCADAVLKLFDGNHSRATQFLQTLAGELEDAAAALEEIVEQGDQDSLRKLSHRLRNGLSTIEAESVIQCLTGLSNLMNTGSPEASEEARKCSRLLRGTASCLRKMDLETSAAK